MCWALSPGEKIYSVTLVNGSKEENGEITRYFQQRPIVKKGKARRWILWAFIIDHCFGDLSNRYRKIATGTYKFQDGD